MGDLPPSGGASNALSREDGAPSAFPGPPSPTQPPVLQHAHGLLGGYQPAPFMSNANQHYGSLQQHGYSQHLDMSQTQYSSGGSPYNMSAMAGALPPHSYRPGVGGQYTQVQGQQRFSPPNVAHSHISNQIPASQAQYEVSSALSPLANQQYYLHQHAAGLPQYYSTSMSPPPIQPTVSPRANTGYYPSPVIMNQQVPNMTTYYYHQGHYPAQIQGMHTQLMPSQYLSSTPPQSDPRLAAAQPAEHYGLSSFVQVPRSAASPDKNQNYVRGPPRKPRQSGHAIWIGNLPPQTDLMNLVHHVCKEAAGLESLFLISKSNCAFANFKDEQACLAAQQKLHDSRFQSVRLVSRLRKNTVEGATGVTAPTGPAAISSQSGPTPSPMVDGASSPRPEPSGEPTSCPAPVVTSDAATPAVGHAVSTPQKDKFFILKSLTVEDLELSVRTGIWATQSHNEEVLNKAFETTENVYLVFSANKSGEYFGYARMKSPINNDPAAAIEFAPKAAAQATTDIDLPKAIPTEPTEFAPKGRIIDDSARGTIFWEADRDDIHIIADGRLQQDDNESAGGSSGRNSVGDASSVRSGYEDGAVRGSESQAWGKPFNLEWMSTNKLPFYRTRGLRNPWNSNREVKIARDGTELEPTVGRRLIGLFNRVQSPVPSALSVGAAVAGIGPGMMSGFVPIQTSYQH